MKSHEDQKSEAEKEVDILERRKLACEIKKLESESSWFSMKISLGDLIPVFIAIITIFAAYFSGILDAKHMQLSSEKALFEIETKEAEQRAIAARDKVVQLEEDLKRSRVELQTQEVLRSVLSQCNSIDDCQVDLNLLVEPPVVNISLVGSPDSRTYFPTMLAKLQSVSGGFRLDSLTIKDFRLTLKQMETIAKFQPSVLSISKNALTERELSTIILLNRLEELRIEDQEIKNLISISQVIGLKSLSLVNLPPSEGLFDISFASALSLESISIDNVLLNKVDCQGFKQFDNLKMLRVERSGLSFDDLHLIIRENTFDLYAVVEDLGGENESLKQIVEIINQLNIAKSDRRIILLEMTGEPDSSGGGLITVQEAMIISTNNLPSASATTNNND